MKVPGLKAKHAIVTDACRELRGDEGTVDESLARLRAEALLALAGWPPGEGTRFHFVLSVERRE